MNCGRGFGGVAGVCLCVGALLHHDFVLARIRLTRTAAERGPVLSGACGQDAWAEIK
jgi:hypothetical protein